MFDIGWQELFIVSILALIVVGPKDLPQAIRTITTWVRKAKMMTRDFQAGVNEMVREAELDDIKDTLTSGTTDLHKKISDAVDPDGELFKGMNLSDGDFEIDNKSGKSSAKSDDVDDIPADEPLTIDDAIEMGVIKPEEDALPEQTAMAVKRKPKATAEPKAKAKPKSKPKTKPKAKAKPKPKTDVKS